MCWNGPKSIVWFLLEPAWGPAGKYSREVKGENVPQNRFFSVFSSRAVLCIFPPSVKNMVIKPRTVEQSDRN